MTKEGLSVTNDNKNYDRSIFRFVKKKDFKMKNKKFGFNTQAIHSGGEKFYSKHALNPPIFQTSTFTFENLQHAEAVMNFESDDYVYTRGNNPTLRLFEERMAILEKGNGAVAFASGMAAISSTLLSLLNPKNSIISNKTLYGSSYSFIKNLLPKYGIIPRFADLTKYEILEKLIDKTTKVIYFETPSNPNLSIINIQKISEISHRNNIIVVIDNTFATPYFQQPLVLGADIVIHSATKYIGGHGDVVAGITIAKDTGYIKKLKFDYMCELGSVLSPFNAWLLLRGMKTLGLRMHQHEKNAIKIAEFLENHPKIQKVYYPGLKSFIGNKTANQQMNGFGAIISFEIKGGSKEAKKFIDHLKLIKLAVSLGDCETLIELPAIMTHRGYPSEELKKFGLSESMIRLSVGLEDINDIITDIEKALETIRR